MDITGPPFVSVRERGLLSTYPCWRFPTASRAMPYDARVARALKVCTARLVRNQCLELSLRDWTVGQYGIWGGLLPAESAELRARLAGWPGEPRCAAS